MDAAAAGARERAPLQLSALPLSCLLLIFARVPVDTRLRCSEVCRAWRAAVADPSVWRHVDLSCHGGIAGKHCGEALLRAAIVRARGSLQALDVPGRLHNISHAATFAAVAASANSLLTLRVCGARNLDETQALLGAAPALRHLDADVDCDLPSELQQACAALRNEPPFERLRVHTLRVSLYTVDRGTVVARPSAADVLQLASAISLHQPLVCLHLSGTGGDAETVLSLPGVLDAVVSAALSCRRLSRVWLYDCNLSPASAPALARLLSGEAMTELEVYNNATVQLFDADAAVLVARALRANSTLTSLKLEEVDFWADIAAAETLLDALRGHVSLRVLNLTCNEMETGCKRAGYALAKLVAADSRALHRLLFMYSGGADEACLSPVFQALPYNTHLLALKCGHNDDNAKLSEQFARAVVLPTVRANTGLEELDVTADDTPAESALCAAEALVAARRS
jgi:hypothetical protein